MEAKKQINQILENEIKPTATTAANENQIKYSSLENKGAFIRIPEAEKLQGETEYLQYTNSRTYKARVITHKYNKVFFTAENEKKEKVQGYLKNNLKILELVSYNTSIAIYDPLQQVLYLRAKYYRCSRTTKKQLDYFLINKPISNKYILSEENYNYIKEDLNPSRLKNINKTAEVHAQRQETVFNIVNHPHLTQDEKAKQLLKNMESMNILSKCLKREELQKLKTRERVNQTYNLYGIEFYISYSKRKKSKKIISKLKLEVKPTYYFKYDLRTTEDTKLYTGWDFRITSNKDDFNTIY